MDGKHPGRRTSGPEIHAAPLASTPGFTLVSIGTLALGLGATSAIFSMINGVLLKPLPYVHPEELVAVWMTEPRLKIADLNMAPSVYFTMRDEGAGVPSRQHVHNRQHNGFRQSSPGRSAGALRHA